MKARVPVTLFMAAFLLGIAALFSLRGSSERAPAADAPHHLETRPMAFAAELAAPLLDREFTSTCLSDKDGFYRETLRFAADATTTFARHYYSDAACHEPSQRESLKEGRYAVAAEEAGHLLLIVRNLYDEKSAALTPYFEALIKVDQEELVMQKNLTTALHYTATEKSI
ncbi:hypothetical protein [Oligoflexus tunisiensis]|uniref:hypothetical protein n=1 Tax=Oligoflexus tunisiensis TaxID=708132 RepID=UPI00114CF0CB|nr:hypothetical protein [Oligoflexus tunisiensis]